MNRPTLKDVAQRAGVSVSTVSYALNDASTAPLAPATKDRIRRIAREIGYVPNGLARSLQSRASRTIGVVLGKPLTIPRYAAVVQGLVAGLDVEGYRVDLLGEKSALDAVAEVRGHRLDGLVFIGHDDQGVPAELIDAVGEHDVPFVAVDCGASAAPSPYSTVDFDYGLGVRQVFAHFAERSIHRIIYVRPDIDSPAERMRARAIADAALVHSGIEVHAVSSGVTSAGLALLDAHLGERLGAASLLSERLEHALAESGRGFASTAIVCAWGADAESVYRIARSHDAMMPVAALAAGTLSVDLWPGLVYSMLPLDQGGREAARLIIASSRDTAAPEHVLLTPDLVSNNRNDSKGH